MQVCANTIQAAEERAMKLLIEQQQIPQFETVKEQEERLKREMEQQEFGEVAINFTLVKPQPEYFYHTSLPVNVSEQSKGSKPDGVEGNSTVGAQDN